MDNIVIYHLHSELSLLDSCTNYKQYIDKAKEYGQPAICFSEHSNIYNWVEKKMYCESSSSKCADCGEIYESIVEECKKCNSNNIEIVIPYIKYLHGIETYLTRGDKVRDNFHTILIAKNYPGVEEINSLIELSSREDHKYYNDRITFDEFFNLSNNVIKISACLSSPLNRIPEDDPIFERLINSYDFLEIQPHINSDDQKEYNKKLSRWSKEYGIPLIAGTDTHSLDRYKAECRMILLKAKRKSYGDEETFDLTFKQRKEVEDMFLEQNCISYDDYMSAIDNTVVMANMVEEFELDVDFKYPKLYDDEEAIFWDRIISMYEHKIKSGIITENPRYMSDIHEEFRVFKKIGMIGFMLFMSELMTWCWENDIPSSPCRGSVGGSTIAYITDITDVDPIVWDTKFSRFANESRRELGDVDLDFAPDDRERVYQYIIDRFGIEYTAYIMTTGTCVDRGTIDEICRALEIPLDQGDRIKAEYESNPEKARSDYPKVFYYFDGILNTVISKGIHPAAIIISPITLSNNYGTFHYDNKLVIDINMEEVHEISLVKYDILGLKNVGVIRDCCKLAGIKYPKSHKIDWINQDVWGNISISNIGIFQFESSYAGECLKKFNPKKINDMSLVNAALRPSGASYRNDLFAKKINENPSTIIDDMLKDNYGYLCFQEDTIKFLQDICGLSGSDADNIRRAIGRKDKERLDKALPDILGGYCNKSTRPRNESEKEAQAFLQIIEDSSYYQFGFNHSTGYSMLGYLCAYMRFYYPLEFCTSLLNNAKGEEDINDGTELARKLNIKIDTIKFGKSNANYFMDKKTNTIYKGIASVKFLNETVANELFELSKSGYKTFADLLFDITRTSTNSRQLDILINLDFFSEFGNSRELLLILDMFRFLKEGTAKSIKKDKISTSEMREVIEKYSISTTAKGEDAKSYTKPDCIRIMEDYENIIKSKKLQDFDLKYKIFHQKEYLGYINSTGREEDRPLLVIKEVYSLKRKRDSKHFGFSVQYISLGSGANNRMSIMNKDWERCGEIKKGDLILCKRYTTSKGGYFNMIDYEHII